MKNKLILVFGLCFLCWGIFTVLDVMGASATMQVKGGKIQAKGGKVVATLPVTPPGPTYDTVPTNGLLMHYTLNGTSKEEVTGSNGTWLAAGGGEGTPSFSNDVPTRLSSGFGYTQSGHFGAPTWSGMEDWRTNLLNGKSCATVACWYRHYGTPVTYDTAVSLGNEGYPTICDWDDSFHVDFYYSGGNVDDYPSSAPAHDTWTHVALTVTNGQPIKTYLNGVLVDDAGTSVSGTIIQTVTTTIGIRSHVDPDYLFKGRLAQVLIYDRVLTTNEIYHLATGN